MSGTRGAAIEEVQAATLGGIASSVPPPSNRIRGSRDRRDARPDDVYWHGVRPDLFLRAEGIAGRIVASWQPLVRERFQRRRNGRWLQSVPMWITRNGDERFREDTH